MLKIVGAKYKKEISIVKKLFLEYEKSIGCDLCFQNFNEEISKLPWQYAEPTGMLFLALYNNKTAGCAALRKLTKNSCEMKRLYVRKRLRGNGIGKKLVNKLINDAIRMGYKDMKLDTLPSMKEAIFFYKSLGFKIIKPYRHNPIKGAQFMQLDLKK